MSSILPKLIIHPRLYYVCHLYDYVVISEGYLYNMFTVPEDYFGIVLNDLLGNELSFNTQEEALLWVANNVKPEYINTSIPKYKEVYRIAKNKELARKYFIPS